MDNIDQLGIEKTKQDLLTLIAKCHNEISKKRNIPFKIVINKKKYDNENDILVDWKNGTLSRTQMECGIKAFVSYQENNEIKVLNAEIGNLYRILEILNGKEKTQDLV